MLRIYPICRDNVQPNLNNSNTDGSLTMAYSDSFLSPHEILPIAQENKYLGKFSFYDEIVCCVHSLETSIESVLMCVFIRFASSRRF